MKSILYIIILLNSFSSFAGVTNGGGGKAIVCRDPQGKIQSAQLLDIYEATAQYGLTLIPAAGSLQEQLKQIQAKVDSLTDSPRIPFEGIPHSFNNTFQKFKFLPKGVGIQPIDDSLDVLIPDRCQVEQLAYFKESNLILVNSDIWEHLDVINQTALVVHENLYQIYRFSGAKDSRDARKATGYLFSIENLVPVADLIPPQGVAYFCETSDRKTKFYLIENHQGANWISFVTLLGQPLFSQMLVEMTEMVDYLMGRTQFGSGELGISTGIRSKLPHRLFDRMAIFVSKAETDREYVKSSLSVLAMDSDFDDKTYNYGLSCYREENSGMSRTVAVITWKKP
jgi:hypothetical protein